MAHMAMPNSTTNWMAPNDTTYESDGAVTEVTNCCTNCVETSCLQQCGPDLPYFGQDDLAGPAGWLALLLIKVGDVEKNSRSDNYTQTNLDLRYMPLTNTRYEADIDKVLQVLNIRLA